MKTQISAEIIEKAKKIKAIILDVDGVMTDGGVIYDNGENEIKKFNVKDGAMIALMRNIGFTIGVITGRKSPVVARRCEELKLHFHYHGIHKKIDAFNLVCENFSLEKEEIAYIGDDLIDLPILKICGLSATPNDGIDFLKDKVDYITQRNGGQACVREFLDLILNAQNRYDEAVKYYAGL